jgi:uncharacterized membrane protein
MGLRADAGRDVITHDHGEAAVTTTSTVRTPAARRGPAPAVLPSLRPWWALVLAGGLLGIVTAAWQTVERIAYTGDEAVASFCDINSLLSCSSVFAHWQSSALGIPNSLIALPVFSVIASAGLAGVLGSRLSRPYLATVLGLTVFMTAFIVWYMQQTAFSIGVLCLFCAGCALTVIVAGIGITRVAATEHALGSGRADRELNLLVKSGADVMAWVGIGLVITVMLGVGLTF